MDLKKSNAYECVALFCTYKYSSTLCELDVVFRIIYHKAEDIQLTKLTNLYNERMIQLSTTNAIHDIRYEMLTSADVSEILGIKRTAAYDLIRKLNNELQAQGKIVIRGKISRLYFESKFFVPDSEAK